MLIAAPIRAQIGMCGAQELTRKWLSANAAGVDLADAMAGTGSGDDRGGTAAIPVVVHVVWNTPAENLPDVVITNMIQTLSEDYQLMNSDAMFVRPVFTASQAGAGISFCLAQLDPYGDPTTGITRTFTPETWFDPSNAADAMKAPPSGTSPWDPFHYLNIWICDISSGASPGSALKGYAYLPVAGMPGSAVDGVVLDYQLAFAPPGRTATHEVGHYLGLLHPWGINGGCSDDDGLSDTPDTDGPTYFCTDPSLTHCGALTQYENFMDYSACPIMFTVEQAAVMNDVLATTRASLTGTGCGPVNVQEFPMGSSAVANPAGEGIEVMWPGSGTNDQVLVVDALGRTVFAAQGLHRKVTIPISALGSGIYNALVTSGARTFHLRFLVARSG